MLASGPIKGLLNVYKVIERLENRKFELLKKVKGYQELGDEFKGIGDELSKKFDAALKKSNLL